MSHLRLRATVCCVAVVGSAMLSGVPAASAAKKPKQGSVTLTATAVFPGVAAPQRYRRRLEPSVLEGQRIVARPDAATIVVVDRATRLVRRHGKRVRVAAPCVRRTLSIGLRPGTEDPLAIVRLLLPRAQLELFWDFLAAPDSPSQPVVRAILAFRLYSDTVPIEDGLASGNAASSVSVGAQRPGGQPGWVTEHLHAERLRHGKACASSEDYVAGELQVRSPITR